MPSWDRRISRERDVLHVARPVVENGEFPKVILLGEYTAHTWPKRQRSIVQS
jgi:hypothetical protein